MSSIPLDLKYILCFIFWVYLKVPAMLWISDTTPGPKYTPSFYVYLGFLNDNKEPTALAKEHQKSTSLKDFYFGLWAREFSSK